MARKILFIIALLVLWVGLFTQLPPLDFDTLLLGHPECCSGQSNLFVYLCDIFTYNLLGLSPDLLFTRAFRFFIYEVPKILILLGFIVFVVGFIQSWFSAEKTRKALEGKPLLLGNFLASFLGVFTPFCSCSAIPLFIGFVEAGIPLGVTFSFLIATPMVNEVALVLLAGLFGWKIALIYISSGVLLATIAGFIIEKLNLKKYVSDWVFQNKNCDECSKIVTLKKNLKDRFEEGYKLMEEVVSKIWLYLLIGIAVGSAAHGYIPDEFLAKTLGAESWYSVPLAILVGVPLYSNAAGVIPVVSVLLEKGVSLGTALAFMMSVIALSLPELVILKNVLKWQFIAIFVGIVAFGILLTGYIFNLIL